MEIKKITFHIPRYKPGLIDPAKVQSYTLSVQSGMTVLECLEKIRLEQDRTLMFRHSCHHSACGTCACVIDGAERLACLTNVWSLGREEVTVEPLRGFERRGDLVVDMSPFYQDIDESWTSLETFQLYETLSKDGVLPVFTRFQRCIECGSCVSACPVSRQPAVFMGPAALAAAHEEMIRSPQKKDALLALTAGDRGQRHCQRALACSRVCPTGVYPARHIAELRRELLASS